MNAAKSSALPRAAGRLLWGCSFAWLLLSTAVSRATAYAPSVSEDEEMDSALFSGLQPLPRKQPSIWWRPSRRTPEAQLDFANGLFDAGRYGRAAKASQALVRRWHNAPQAAKAQELLADSLYRQRKYRRAFREYQYLIKFFPGQFRYREVIDRQFAIANLLRTQTGGFLGFGDHTQHALVMFEQIVANAPDGPHAPEAQLYKGLLHEASGEIEEAIISFEILSSRYPRSPRAMDALYHGALCRYKLAKRYPRDENTCRSALSSLSGLLSKYPRHPRADQVQQKLDELKEHLARQYFERAAFYDRLRHNPQAAAIAYEEFRRQFPDSRFAQRAGERLEELGQPGPAASGSGDLDEEDGTAPSDGGTTERFDSDEF